MASSMCGPSNALSSLQKHTTTDRSLQQDHLQLPASSPQVFRSNVTNNRQLDSEFDQFSANGIPQDVHQHLHHLHQTPTPRLDAWASDFRRLHIGAHQGPVAAPPLLQQQQQKFGQSQAVANWHEEFMQRQQPQASSHMSESLLRGPSMGMYSGGLNQMAQPVYIGGVVGAGIIQTSNSAQQKTTAQFDDAAFEQAFENAKAQLAESQDREQLEEAVRETVVAQGMVEGRGKDKEHDSDELARTAAQLLDSLSGNQSQKFQDSTFLALMRRLRDREVKVEGDKMVETVQTPGERPAVQLST